MKYKQTAEYTDLLYSVVYCGVIKQILQEGFLLTLLTIFVFEKFQKPCTNSMANTTNPLETNILRNQYLC